MSSQRSVPKSFRDFDTLTLARMVYGAMDTPASVLAERVLKYERCHECGRLVGECEATCHMAATQS